MGVDRGAVRVIGVGILAGQEEGAAPVLGTVTLRWPATVAMTARADISGAVTSPLVWGPMPVGTVAGDVLLAIHGGKRYDWAIPTPSGYTEEAVVTSGTTGVATNAGSLRNTLFSKVHSGSESSPSTPITVYYGPAMLLMVAAGCDDVPGGCTIETTTGFDGDTSGSSISATGGSLEWAVGDVILFYSSGPDATAGESSPSLSFTGGVTAGALTEHLSPHSTTAGYRGTMYVYTATITGAGTGAPTFAATSGGTDKSERAVTFIKITPPTA